MTSVEREYVKQMMDASNCECGHGFTDHVPLPYHPDGAEECYGDESCECGKYKRQPR